MGSDGARGAPLGVRRVVLCFVLRHVHERPEVLLGRKKRGFGTGKVVGLGGHLLPGESERTAAAREVAEESGLSVDPALLRPAGEVLFRFPTRPDWDMHTTVFVVDLVGADPVETEEIAPQWYPVEALPLECMWSDAGSWIPSVLAGRVISGTVTYGDDNEAMVGHDLRSTAARDAYMQ